MIFIKRVPLFEILLIILSSHFILKVGDFHSFLYIFPDFYSYNSVTTIAQRFDWRGRDDFSSFVEKNLDIDYSDNRITSGERKLWSPDGNVQTGPMYLTPGEKKPYYLFNIHIHYSSYSARLFRRFTIGDGTPEFAENNKEIKAVVFHQKDFEKLKNIKRKIKKVILQGDRYKIYLGNCTVINGIRRLYKTDFAKERKYWKFIPSESSGVAKYSLVPSVDGFDYVHYLESPEIVGKPTSMVGEYFFSVGDVVINPLLPFEIICDVKTNYPEVNVNALVGVYDVDGTPIDKIRMGDSSGSRKRGVWVKESGGNLSVQLEKGTKNIYKLEKIILYAKYNSNEERGYNIWGFQPLGILFFDD